MFIAAEKFFRIGSSLLAIMLTAGAATAVFAATRSEIITNQLDCFDQTEPISWVDVCYTSELPAAKFASRHKAVTAALDEYEGSDLADERIAVETITPKIVVTDYDGEISEMVKAAPVPVMAANKKPADPQDKGVDAKFSLTFDYRKDELVWSIADTDGVPNILSELTFDDLVIYQLTTQANITFAENFLFDFIGSYGTVYDGNNQDSDYLGNNRTLEFSRSNNTVDDDEVFDLSFALGYKMFFSFPNDYSEAEEFSLAFLGGYSHHEQKLGITDGNQTIPAYGLFPGLESTYETEWKGPWLGLELAGYLERASGFFRFEYHMVDYYADAHWNLRGDLASPTSFEHIADGQGFVFRVGGDYALTDHWSLHLGFNYSDWETDSGIDRVFFSNQTTAETRLNEVTWTSYAFQFGTSYVF